tara:strand:- start:887 stop:1585 length:699 start_codon:yes stop_codon:yes gene_type:complete
MAVMVLSACAGGSRAQLNHHQASLKSPERFFVCHGYGCRYYVPVGLAPGEWERVKGAFSPAAQSPAEERQQIKQAIALMEKLVGPKSGTAKDEGRARLLNLAPRGQMDCVDEAFNTSTYLYLMRQAGLIRWHRLGKPVSRGNFLDGWPHNSATIQELDAQGHVRDGGHYVVDSWFHKNGAPPEIVPVPLWLDGWSPPRKADKNEPISESSSETTSENFGPEADDGQPDTAAH